MTHAVPRHSGMFSAGTITDQGDILPISYSKDVEPRIMRKTMDGLAVGTRPNPGTSLQKI